MKWKDFDDYCTWLFDVLFELEKRLDISNYNAYQSGDITNINPLTKGETNNMLLELERKLFQFSR